MIFKEWDGALLGTYGERFKTVSATEAAQLRPLQKYSAQLSLQWFPSLLSGSQQSFADANWGLSKLILDTFDKSTNAYALSTDEDRAKIKPQMGVFLWTAGD